MLTKPIRKGSLESWTQINPILGNDEFGWEKDTNQIKIGDGITPWNDLPYFNGVFQLSKDKKYITIINDDEIAGLKTNNENKIEQIISADIGELRQPNIIATPVGNLSSSLKQKRKRKKASKNK